MPPLPPRRHVIKRLAVAPAVLAAAIMTVLLAAHVSSGRAQPAASIALPSPGGTVQLHPWCNNVSLTFENGTPSETVVQAVTPSESVQAMWRHNAALNRFEGFSPAAPQASDLLTVNFLDAVWLCLSAAPATPPAATPPAPTSAPPTGVGIIGGPVSNCPVFPPDNPWNTDISGLPVHPRSDAYIDAVGRGENLHPDFGTMWEGAPNGIPYVIASGDQPKVPVSFEYHDESDPGPYPIPPDAPIEGGPDSDGDRHVIVIDDDNCILYELFYAHPINEAESWQADSGAIFDLTSNDLRPDFWTSADAAGLPIFPGLVRYEEVVEQGVIDHALRFTVEETQQAFIHPATHYASDDTNSNLPPMGLRLRMKAEYDCSVFSREVQVICAALKTYGMFVADNGADWFISGAPDERWSNDNLGDLKEITGDALEVVDTGEEIITD